MADSLALAARLSASTRQTPRRITHGAQVRSPVLANRRRLGGRSPGALLLAQDVEAVRPGTAHEPDAGALRLQIALASALGTVI